MNKTNFLIIANWKLNGNKKQIYNYINKFLENISDISKSEISIAPPLIYLDFTYQLIKNSKISLTAQYVDINLSGSFTGEISAEMLKDIGVKYVIIGHSERRLFHNENNLSIIPKIEIVKNLGLIPIICFGENFSEKIEKKTEIICKSQINLINTKLGKKIFDNTILGYEPIWAIGTGKSENPVEIEKIHSMIRNHLITINKNIGDNIIILYGGSVNKDNILNLINKKNINGFLIGNSSLNVDNFIKIIKLIEK